MATLPDLMNGWQAGAPTSAMLAMRTHHAVQRFACLACLQQVTAPPSDAPDVKPIGCTPTCSHARDLYICLAMGIDCLPGLELVPFDHMMCMQGLLQGVIAEKCPLGDLSEEAMKEREVREGLEVELHRRLPCSVSFTRGQERSVHFAIVGLPQVRGAPVSLLYGTLIGQCCAGVRLHCKHLLQIAVSRCASCNSRVHQLSRVA